MRALLKLDEWPGKDQWKCFVKRGFEPHYPLTVSGLLLSPHLISDCYFAKQVHHMLTGLGLNSGLLEAITTVHSRVLSVLCVFRIIGAI